MRVEEIRKSFLAIMRCWCLLVIQHVYSYLPYCNGKGTSMCVSWIAVMTTICASTRWSFDPKIAVLRSLYRSDCRWVYDTFTFHNFSCLCRGSFTVCVFGSNQSCFFFWFLVWESAAGDRTAAREGGGIDGRPADHEGRFDLFVRYSVLMLIENRKYNDL